MLLALIGPDHKHFMYQEIQLADFRNLPKLDSKFVRADGSINFGIVREELSSVFEQDRKVGLNGDETRSDESDEFCQIVGGWHVPAGPAPDWAGRQLAWRMLVRIEFVDGRRKVPGLYIDGGRRLAVDSCIQIGYRRNPDRAYAPIFLAGPYHETAYTAVTEEQVALSAWRLAWASRECPRHFFARDLLPPQDPTPVPAKPEPAPRPVSERPSLLSVTGLRPDVAGLHERLHNVLSPGSEAVPGFPGPAMLEKRPGE